jgi:hypothetical protein
VGELTILLKKLVADQHSSLFAISPGQRVLRMLLRLASLCFEYGQEPLSGGLTILLKKLVADKHSSLFCSDEMTHRLNYNVLSQVMSLKMEDPLLVDLIKKLVKDKHSSLFTAMLVT